jgi:uncharacterized protein (TIGR02757 family)
MKLAEKDLKVFLDEKYELYNRPSFIENDPIGIPRKFSLKEDIEIAAFFSATIAWGQRPTIISNANRLMDLMDNQPYQYIMNSEKGDWKRFAGFVHRTFQYADTVYFIKSLQNIYHRHGGLEKVFSEGSKKDIKTGIMHFRKIFLEIDPQVRNGKTYSECGKECFRQKNKYVFALDGT